MINKIPAESIPFLGAFLNGKPIRRKGQIYDGEIWHISAVSISGFDIYIDGEGPDCAIHKLHKSIIEEWEIY